jgi:hypothetical protein
VICEVCGHDNPQEHRFCCMCGTPLETAVFKPSGDSARSERDTAWYSTAAARSNSDDLAKPRHAPWKMSPDLKCAAKKIILTCFGLLRQVAAILGDMTVLVLYCQHKKLSYPPRWYGKYIYNVCMRCGRMQLYDPYTASGYGEFSHHLGELIAAAENSALRKQQQPRNPKGNAHRRSA